MSKAYTVEIERYGAASSPSAPLPSYNTYPAVVQPQYTGQTVASTGTNSYLTKSNTVMAKITKAKKRQKRYIKIVNTIATILYCVAALLVILQVTDSGLSLRFSSVLKDTTDAVTNYMTETGGGSGEPPPPTTAQPTVNTDVHIPVPQTVLNTISIILALSSTVLLIFQHNVINSKHGLYVGKRELGKLFENLETNHYKMQLLKPLIPAQDAENLNTFFSKIRAAYLNLKQQKKLGFYLFGFVWIGSDSYDDSVMDEVKPPVVHQTN